METFHFFIRFLKKLGAFILELVLPSDPSVREIEMMTAATAAETFKKAERPAVSWIRAFFDYKDERVQKAVWELKYRGNPRIVALFGTILADSLLEEISELGLLEHFKNPILVPLPLSPQRRRERGFNQCELILDEVKKRSPGVEISYSALRKVKNTKPQTSFTKKKDRLENLRGAFAANAPEIDGRNIILFDDVATTGRTLDEARRTLLEAGARDVIAYAIAH